MITTPEWEHWRQMPHAALWEYVALSCGIEPRKTSYDRLTARGFNEYIYEHLSSSYERKQCERYQSRIDIAVAHLEAENLQLASQIVKPTRLTKIKLDDFLLWTTEMSWDLPIAMIKMKVASNIMPNKEALIAEEVEIKNRADDMQEEARGILQNLPYGDAGDKEKRAKMMVQAKKLMAKAEAMQNVQQDEKAGDEDTTGKQMLAVTNMGNAFQRMEKLEWKEIQMTFVADNTVKIEARDHMEQKHYAELGLKRKNTKDAKPAKAWEALRDRLANKDEAMGYQFDKQLKSRIVEIRKALRGYFGIDSDPFFPTKGKDAPKPGHWVPRMRIYDKRTDQNGEYPFEYEGDDAGRWISKKQ